MQENSTYRIRTKVGDTTENVINVKLDQHYDMFEILSLKIDQKNFYKTYEAGYGVVVGRVLANGGFGVPNAKVSIFIESDDNDDLMRRIYYPYKSPQNKNADGVRYNLLTDFLDKACYQNVGTFPNKRLVLDNDDVIDIFDKYYRYTTVTNSAGDYMIFGVPTGSQRLHVDIDLSDIGMLSQRPRDMIYKGYNINQFESPNKFKQDTNLNSLAQIMTQDIGVYVYPYWGDTSEDTDNIAVTRADIQLDYKFEPTCVFIGSIITDTGSNAIGKNCTSTDGIGKMSELIAGEGSIEMIRKTYDGKVEEFQVKGNRVIDGDGVWCYQIPMNLDYIVTDEFGNIVPSDNPEKGIPTRTRVRFRISIDEAPSDNTARKRCRYLVPNNPRLDSERFPQFTKTKEPDYEFGSRTREESYKDLLWNKVYTVKNYVPRLQKNRKVTDRRHTGIKLINHHEGNNPMPYNNVDIKLGFTYRMLCVIFKIFINLVQFLNQILTALSLGFCVIYKTLMWIAGLFKFPVKFLGWPFRKLAELFEMLIMPCVGISADMCSGNTTHNLTFYPGCGNLMFSGKSAGAAADCIEDKTAKSHKKKEDKKIKDKEMDESERTVPLMGGTEELYNCVETALAEDNDTISLNFQNDWVNGTLYAPMWFRKITKKRRYFFGLIKRRAKDQWCEGEKSYTRKILRVFNPCSPKRNAEGNQYTNFNGENVRPRYMKFSDDKRYSDSCRDKCHEATKAINLDKGLIVKRETMLGQDVYYYKPVEYGSIDETLIDDSKDFAVAETGDNGSVKLLFATDIVLLGSLNDCDIHGVPQFFKSLESTTFNLPPSILFTDNEIQITMKKGSSGSGKDDDPDSVDTKYEVTEISSSEMTGMDWGNFNDDICGKWNDSQDSGLFYSIGCSTIKMKPKSCVNMTRICEFGVSLDEAKDILSPPSTGVNSETNPIDEALYSTLIPDGFISKDELYNEDERSMFATLNVNGLITERNPENGLMEYVFKHVVADNFDKSLNEYMLERQRKCNKTQRYNYLLEEFSAGYYDFRMGKTPYYYDKEYRFPRYENSFYFYFGLNPGKTAIDKFNSQFTSNCLNDGEDISPINIDYVANSWCSDMKVEEQEDGKTKFMGDGYVAFDLTAVDLPCDIAIESVNESVNGVFSIYIEGNTYEKFYIAYEEIESDDLSDYTCITEYGSIPNGEYRITITDNSGEIITTTLIIEPQHIKSYIVGTDFYEPDNVLMGRLQSRGKIAADAVCIPANNSSDLNINSTRKIGGTIAVSTPYEEKTGDKYDNFIIEIDNDNLDYHVKVKFNANSTPNLITSLQFPPPPQTGENVMFRYDSNVFIFGVPKGDETYVVTITQLCDDAESGNVMAENVFIREIAPYKLFINGSVDYDVIKHWKSGFKVTEVSNNNGTAEFDFDGTVCDKWWNMSNEKNYLWCNFIPYQDIDKQICSNVEVFNTIVNNYDGSVNINEGIDSECSLLRDSADSDGHFMYTPMTPKNDSNYLCSDSANFSEIDIDDAVIKFKRECRSLFKSAIKDSVWDGYIMDYYPDGTPIEREKFREFVNGNDPDGIIKAYDVILWVLDNRDYMARVEENFSTLDEIPPYIDLLFVDMEIIDLLGDVAVLKNDFINNTKSAFQLTCSDSSKSIFFSVETKDLPVAYHNIYTPDILDDETGLYTLDDYAEKRAYYTKEDDGIDTVAIPTITYKGSARFGNTKQNKQITSNLCFSTDNSGNKRSKYVNFISVINSKGRTIPNDAEYTTTGDNECGIGVDYMSKVINGNYFGYHIIDKIFENRFMMWSHFNRIPYYKPMNGNNYDQTKAGASICMNGIFASKIFNGNATEYVKVYVYKNWSEPTKVISETAYGELSSVMKSYYEECYQHKSDSCIVISKGEYDDLQDTTTPGDEEGDGKDMYDKAYRLIATPPRTISVDDYENLSPESEKSNYELSYETIFEEQEFTPYTFNIYTGREDDETDAQVEDRMPTIRYVVGENLKNGQMNVERHFLNYRVTGKDEPYNSDLWALYNQQYVSVNNREIEMNLSDENACFLSEQLDGRMRIVLASDSVNLCSTDKSNHRDKSVFHVKLENANGENVTYYVFTTEQDGEDADFVPYPLNYAEAYNDCSDTLLCRTSKFDMVWDDETDETEEVFSKVNPRNLFSYYTEPVFEGKTAKLGNAPTRKQLKSKYVDPVTGDEKDSEGYGTTGEFKLEKHDNPYFVVAITDNNCRAISPVYDYTYVCAKLIFGVVYSKSETTDENGFVNGYEFIESPKMTFDVSNVIKRTCNNNNDSFPSNITASDIQLYYFYFYPYEMSFDIKIDGENTVSGNYTHPPYMNDIGSGYQLFDIDKATFDSLKDIYKGSNNKVGDRIRKDTVIEAVDYTGLKHIVDWRGCKQSDFASDHGCGHPYEFKAWVSVTWVTNGGQWKQSQNCVSDPSYIEMVGGCSTSGNEANQYYGSTTNFTRVFETGDSYNIYKVGDVAKQNCDNEETCSDTENQMTLCDDIKQGFLGWSRSYDSMEVVDPSMDTVTIPSSFSDPSDAKQYSAIYYAVYGCDFVNVMWYDQDGSTLIAKECGVRRGTAYTFDEMPQPSNMPDDKKIIDWVVMDNTDGAKVNDERIYYILEHKVAEGCVVKFKAVYSSAVTIPVKIINNTDTPYKSITFSVKYDEYGDDPKTQEYTLYRVLFENGGTLDTTIKSFGQFDELTIDRVDCVGRDDTEYEEMGFTASPPGYNWTQNVEHNQPGIINPEQIIIILGGCPCAFTPDYRYTVTWYESVAAIEGTTPYTQETPYTAADGLPPESVYQGGPIPVVPSPTKPGYTFDRWMVYHYADNVDVPVESILCVCNNMKIYATWIPKFIEAEFYAVLSRDEGEKLITIEVSESRHRISRIQKQDLDNARNLFLTQNPGTAFSGVWWPKVYIDGSWDSDSDYVLDDNLTSYPIYEKTRFYSNFVPAGNVSIGFVAYAGHTVTIAEYAITSGTGINESDVPSISAVDTALSGEGFGNGIWHLNSEDGETKNASQISQMTFSDTTVFYAEVSHSVQFIKNGQPMLPEPYKIVRGQTLTSSGKTVPDPSETGKTFVGWIVNGDNSVTISSGDVAVLGIDMNYTFTAKYETTQVTITFNWDYNTFGITANDLISGNSLAENFTQTVDYGDKPNNVTEVPSEVLGHEFVGWNFGGATIPSNQLSTQGPQIEADCTAYGKWSAPTYSVVWKKCDGETTFRTDSSVPHNFKYGVHSGFTVPTAENVEMSYCTFTRWGSEISEPIRENKTFAPECNCMLIYPIPYYIHNNTEHEINTISIKLEVRYSGGSTICDTNMGAGLISSGGSHYHTDFYSDAFPENWTYFTYDSCLVNMSGVGEFTINIWNVSHEYKTDSTGTYKMSTRAVYYSPDGGQYNPDGAFHIYIDEVEEPTPPPVQTYSVTFRVYGDGANATIIAYTGLSGSTDVSSLGIPTEQQILQATPDSNAYNFNGWDNNPNTTVTQATTFTAQVSKKTFSVEFRWNDPNNTIVIRSGIVYGTTVSDVPQASSAPAYANHTFDGWSPNPSTTPITASGMYFDGQWSEIPAQTWTVTFRIKDEDTNTTLYTFPTVPVTDGNTLTSAQIPTEQQILANTGNQNAYTFDEWVNSGGGIADFSLPITANKTFYALVQKKTFTVTFDHNNGSGETTVISNVEYGSSVRIAQSPSYSGHNFLGWKLGNQLYQPDTYYQSVTSNITFIGQWSEIEPTTHTVTFVFGLDGVSNVTQTVVDGGVATAPTIPTVDGYQFYQWDGDITQRIYGDITFTAIWKVKVEFTAVGGTIVGNAVQYLIMNDEHATVPSVTPNTGKTFTGEWVISGSSRTYSSSTIAGWTFDEPYTFEAVIEDVVAYTVEFYIHNGSSDTRIGSAYTVESGNTITPPNDNAISNAISGTGMTRFSQSTPWRISNANGTFNTYGDTYSTAWFGNNGITSDMKFFLRTAYTVVFDYDQSTLSNVTQTVEQGHHASVPTPGAVENCTFTGNWDSSVSGLATDSAITANVTFTALWNCQEPVQTHMVRFFDNGSQIASYQIEHGTTIVQSSYSIPSASGANFIGWVYNGVTKTVAQVNSMTINSDCDFYALYQKNYTISYRIVNNFNTSDDRSYPSRLIIKFGYNLGTTHSTTNEIEITPPSRGSYINGQFTIPNFDSVVIEEFKGYNENTLFDDLGDGWYTIDSSIKNYAYYKLTYSGPFSGTTYNPDDAENNVVMVITLKDQIEQEFV